mmetsp:Transcript_32292/g.106581  ORF Transcript_32292/g.106581 Transcript_32292/m.106581 type:complete len:317 (+) Transcript_32292:1049-1999(+)
MACGVYLFRQSAAFLLSDCPAVAFWKVMYIRLCHRVFGGCFGSDAALHRGAYGMGGQGAQDAIGKLALHGKDAWNGPGLCECSQGILAFAPAAVRRCHRVRFRGGAASFGHEHRGRQSRGARVCHQVHRPVAPRRRCVRLDGVLALRIGQRRLVVLQVRRGRQPGAAADVGPGPHPRTLEAGAGAGPRVAGGEGVACRCNPHLGEVELLAGSATPEALVDLAEVCQAASWQIQDADRDRRLAACWRLGVRCREDPRTADHTQHRGAALWQEQGHRVVLQHECNRLQVVPRLLIGYLRARVIAAKSAVFQAPRRHTW